MKIIYTLTGFIIGILLCFMYNKVHVEDGYVSINSKIIHDTVSTATPDTVTKIIIGNFRISHDADGYYRESPPMYMFTVDSTFYADSDDWFSKITRQKNETEQMKQSLLQKVKSLETFVKEHRRDTLYIKDTVWFLESTSPQAVWRKDKDGHYRRQIDFRQSDKKKTMSIDKK